MEYKLPVFNIVFNPLKSSFDVTSLVEYPAIESNFIKFGKDSPKMNFSIQNDEKRIICGAIAIPDKLIYRYDSNIGEYYIKFSKETIEKMRNHWGQSYWNEFTLDHEWTRADVSMIETWIKESEVHDKSLIYNINEPVGTMFMSCKVHSDELWKQIKEGKYNGFSIEIWSEMELDQPIHEVYKKQNNMKEIKHKDGKLLSLSGLDNNGNIPKGSVIYTEDKKPYSGEFSFEKMKYKTNDFGQIESIEKIEESKYSAEDRIKKLELGLETIQLAFKKQDEQQENIKNLMQSVQGIATKLSKAEPIDSKLPVEQQEVLLSRNDIDNINDFFSKFNKASNSLIR